MSAGKSISILICGILFICQYALGSAAADDRFLAGFEIEIIRLIDVPEPVACDCLPEQDSWWTPDCNFLDRYLARNRKTGFDAERTIGDPDIAKMFVCRTFSGVSEPCLAGWSHLNSLKDNASAAITNRVRPVVRQWLSREWKQLANIEGPLFLNTIRGVIFKESGGTAPVSIETPKQPADQPESLEPKLDDYWQYYDDCDEWDVIFASRVMGTPGLVGLIGERDLGISKHGPVSQLIQGLASKNLFMIAGSGHQIIRQTAFQVRDRLRIEPIRWVQIEEFSKRFLKQTPSANLYKSWVVLNIQLILRDASPIDAVRGQMKTVAGEASQFWGHRVFPLIRRSSFQNVRFLHEQKLENCRTQRATANRIALLGQDLLEVSGQMLQRIEIRECELAHELAVIEDKQRDDRLANAKADKKIK